MLGPRGRRPSGLRETVLVSLGRTGSGAGLAKGMEMTFSRLRAAEVLLGLGMGMLDEREDRVVIMCRRRARLSASLGGATEDESCLDGPGRGEGGRAS